MLVTQTINDDANVTIVGYSTSQSFKSAVDNSLAKYVVII